MIVVGGTRIDGGEAYSPVIDYNLEYTSVRSQNHRLVEQFSLAELAGKYINILWDDGSHKYNVKSFLGEIDEILKGVRFSGFDQEMLDSVIGSLRERGNSNATINRKMAALSKLLRKAHKMGDIYNLPEFVRQKERAGRIRFLEYEEEKRLFAAVKARCEDSYRLSIFLVDTGCRLGEAIGLTWNDIQEHRVTFWLTKSNRSRTVPLTKRARKSTDIAHERLKGPFSMLNQVRFRQIWNDAKIEVGLGTDDQVVPHILRHTCASRLVRGGIDIRRVQMWLGHQTLQMTMRYAHLATHDLDSCVKVLEIR
ncbi:MULTISPECIES: tyrosine-type recombinase/integrase [Brucella]|jgi:integrase|uniref:Phage integrase family protein n=1 Tax=Brucella pseudogrignonensis TaxID=419475 RepID=A0A256GLC7_9HYPH|nr:MULTISPECIES: site-specific integrase [Brucella]EMG54948.1 phage integrase family protein [Ochrobactrum sp. CDB2]MBO1024252.1 site-specific integrase [Ochrobactrum sp. SD129]MQP41900.1 tyrosine-type recombinase/integrase [Ochrobactrum sp. MYb237]QWK78238.1 site-specific integrase [Ochrobactrum sp. BTU1]KAB2691250.1 tyrosine-type recombinase/integrase [Brucella pseudogrignonensis]